MVGEILWFLLRGGGYCLPHGWGWCLLADKDQYASQSSDIQPALQWNASWRYGFYLAFFLFIGMELFNYINGSH